MLSLQEIKDKAQPQLQSIEEFMDKNGFIDQSCQSMLYRGLKRSIQREISETLRKVTLREMLQHPAGLTTGTASVTGSPYLIPIWVSGKLYSTIQFQDIVPMISADMVEAAGLQGRVNFASTQIGDDTGGAGVGGGEFAHETPSLTGQATYNLKRVAIPLAITSDMLEDNEYGLMEASIRYASTAIANRANYWALKDLAAASDGIGTANSSAAAADETTIANVKTGYEAMADDNFKADTIILTNESLQHSVSASNTALYIPEITWPLPSPGFDFRFWTMDGLINNSSALCTRAGIRDDQVAGAGAMTDCKTILFTRTVALVTLRKNWLRVENYADPVKDLAGVVVSGRQDSVTVNKYAIAVLTEA